MQIILQAPFIIQVSLVMIAFVYIMTGNWFYSATLKVMDVENPETAPHDSCFMWVVFVLLWPAAFVIGLVVGGNRKQG